jgi:hypothetical protein
MAFTRWSEGNPKAKAVLQPDLGLRSWLALSSDDRKNFILHLTNREWLGADAMTHSAARNFSDDNKVRNYFPGLLTHGGPHTYDRSYVLRDCCKEVAQADVVRLLVASKEDDVVYEFFSYYAEQVHSITYDNSFERFSRIFNDLTTQYGLDVMLAESGLIPRQDGAISEHIYVPTLKALSDPKWEPVNRDLNDAFSDFLKNTAEGYSSCVTHTVSAVQAFLQIIVYGATGKGDLGDLLATALKEGKIPSDPFSTRVFKDIESILMQERQTKGDPHPKQEYANEKSARLLLNLTMVFFQHSLQK